MLKEYLDLREVESYTSLKRTTIYVQIKIGGFPSPVQLKGVRRNIWRRNEIETWMKNKISEWKIEKEQILIFKEINGLV